MRGILVLILLGACKLVLVGGNFLILFIDCEHCVDDLLIQGSSQNGESYTLKLEKGQLIFKSTLLDSQSISSPITAQNEPFTAVISISSKQGIIKVDNNDPQIFTTTSKLQNRNDLDKFTHKPLVTGLFFRDLVTNQNNINPLTNTQAHFSGNDYAEIHCERCRGHKTFTISMVLKLDSMRPCKEGIVLYLVNKEFTRTILLEIYKCYLRLCITRKQLKKCSIGESFTADQTKNLTLTLTSSKIVYESNIGTVINMALEEPLSMYPVIYFGGIPTLGPGRGFAGWLKYFKVNDHRIPLFTTSIRSDKSIHTINFLRSYRKPQNMSSLHNLDYFMQETASKEKRAIMVQSLDFFEGQSESIAFHQDNEVLSFISFGPNKPFSVDKSFIKLQQFGSLPPEREVVVPKIPKIGSSIPASSVDYHGTNYHTQQSPLVYPNIHATLFWWWVLLPLILLLCLTSGVLLCQKLLCVLVKCNNGKNICDSKQVYCKLSSQPDSLDKEMNSKRILSQNVQQTVRSKEFTNEAPPRSRSLLSTIIGSFTSNQSKSDNDAISASKASTKENQSIELGTFAPKQINKLQNQSFHNQNQSFDNQNQSFHNQNQSFDNQNQSFHNQNQSFDNQKSTFDKQKLTFDKQKSTLDKQQSTFDNQKSTFDKQKSTFDKQKSTFDKQQSPFNKQKSLDERTGSRFKSSLKISATQDSPSGEEAYFEWDVNQCLRNCSDEAKDNRATLLQATQDFPKTINSISFNEKTRSKPSLLAANDDLKSLSDFTSVKPSTSPQGSKKESTFTEDEIQLDVSTINQALKNVKDTSPRKYSPRDGKSFRDRNMVHVPLMPKSLSYEEDTQDTGYPPMKNIYGDTQDLFASHDTARSPLFKGKYGTYQGQNSSSVKNKSFFSDKSLRADSTNPWFNQSKRSKQQTKNIQDEKKTVYQGRKHRLNQPDDSFHNSCLQDSFDDCLKRCKNYQSQLLSENPYVANQMEVDHHNNLWPMANNVDDDDVDIRVIIQLPQVCQHSMLQELLTDQQGYKFQ